VRVVLVLNHGGEFHWSRMIVGSVIVIVIMPMGRVIVPGMVMI
jgi:hypothetical protein